MKTKLEQRIQKFGKQIKKFFDVIRYQRKHKTKQRENVKVFAN